ncbi:hypothetical protein [Helicobacter bizzozeronii]|nr:hypothetical protein [Helicobacter bizzozeronii]
MPAMLEKYIEVLELQIADRNKKFNTFEKRVEKLKNDLAYKTF